MRISDWSSDVCSSDLLPGDLGRPILAAQANGETVPVPPMGSQNDSRVAEAEQARQRLVQEREAARASRLFLGGSNPTPQSGASAGVSPITGEIGRASGRERGCPYV